MSSNFINFPEEAAWEAFCPPEKGDESSEPRPVLVPLATKVPSRQQQEVDERGELTELIELCAAGDHEADRRFWPSVYDDLQDQARQQLQGDGNGDLQSARLAGNLLEWLRRTQPESKPLSPNLINFPEEAAWEALEEAFHPSENSDDSSERTPVIFPLTTNVPVEQEMNHQKGELTELIELAAAGDHEAERRFWSLVYDELRHRARQQLQGDGDGYLQSAHLVGNLFEWARRTGELGRVANRKHFYARAASKMRNLLLDHHRKRNKENARYVPLDPVFAELCESAAQEIESRSGFTPKELNNALRRLRRKHRRQYDIMRMHIWLGLALGEIAEALELSKSVVERDWRLAKARLYDELRK